MAAPIGNGNHLIHGGVGTRLYNIWKTMRQRCYNPNNNKYYNYGARGVTICDEWDDFSAFRDWAYQNSYNENLTIDRIDNNGNYEPSNCRWVTLKQQERNKRNNKRYEFDGKNLMLTEWAELYGINYKVLWNRVVRKGLSMEKALDIKTKEIGDRNE